MTTASNKEALLIKAVKDAHALRQLLFDRPDGYTREEMLGANALIQKATQEWWFGKSAGFKPTVFDPPTTDGEEK